MLTKELLTEALTAALKGADPACTRFCTAGAELAADDTYRVWHNGTGSRDTADATVYGQATLALNMEQMAGRLRTWIQGLHKGEAVDLNAKP